MNRLVSLVAVCFIAGAIAAIGITRPSGTGPTTARAATINVSITAGGFSPASVSVAAGDTVLWANNSGTPQTVNSLLNGNDPNFFSSGFIYANGSYSHAFPTAGTYYYKSVTSNLQGDVVVGGGGGPTNTPTSTATQSGGGGANSVSITAGGFVPAVLNVSAGTQVTWTNNSTTTQTVNSYLNGNDPNFFSSGFIYANGSYSHTFNVAGTFTYRSVTTNLQGSVVVGGGGGGNPTNTPANTATPTNTPTPAGQPGSTNTPTPTQTPTQPGQPGSTNTPTPTTIPSQPSATPTQPGIPQQPAGNWGYMNPGWNLAAYSGNATSPSLAFGPLGGNYTAIYAWNGQTWLRWFQPGTVPAYVNSLTNVSQGQAFWIFLSAAYYP